MGIVYDGRCPGCGYGHANCHCIGERLKVKNQTTGIGAYVIETDGSIHEMVFAGDGDWKEEAVTTLSDIRNKAIDEFVKILDECSGYTKGCVEDLCVTRTTYLQVAEHLKEKSNENSSKVCW